MFEELATVVLNRDIREQGLIVTSFEIRGTSSHDQA
ncbi:MAG: hypothetical protein BECKG1743D_GA0114223_100825 [Candidatus Kentron sp. G]|nr:MAG: hypothetical protein BECKG1743D_GA0114223_100825 [Candidatus Kentron sp. G]